MSDPKPIRASLRLDTLASALQQKLENEAGVLDLLIAALARGQGQETLWDALHDAALRDDRLAELGFAYERLSKDKKLKSLNPASQTAFFLHAGTFFAEVFGDADGAEPYLERAFAISPADPAAFKKLEAVLSEKNATVKLGELYAAAAPSRPDRAEQLRFFQHAAKLLGVDEERALKLHQEILKLDPGDQASRRALEERYEKTGRLADLARLLEQSLSADPPPAGDEARSLHLRLMSLYAGGLGEVERALPHVEAILVKEPEHPAARAVATELVSHKPLAARVAAVLATAYDQSGDTAEAAQMIGVEIDALRGPRRLEAQKKLATYTFERLGDLARAMTLDEAILPLDPSDHEVRARYVKLSSALDKQLEATKALSRASTAARDAGVKARISVDLGDLFIELGDGRKARVAYQAALDARADDAATLRAARALESICAEAKDHRALAAVLSRLSEVEPEEEARALATIKLAGLCEVELRDPPGAIAAHRKLLGTRREAEALPALERLLEATGAHADLAEVLELRAASERDRPKARELSFRAAELRSSRLPDRAAALAAWQAFVERYGASREVLSRLIPLLEMERRWEELGAALGDDAALAPDAERAAILSRLGQVRLARLGDARGALDAHRRALAIDPSDRASRLALDKMLAAGELRLAAAEVLEPLARAEGAWTVLLRVLEARAALLEDPGERLRSLEEAALVAHRELRDHKRAVEVSSRGLELALEARIEAAPAWIERVEQLSAGDAARSAAALRRVLGDRAITGPELGMLARRTGEALAQSGDPAGALGVLRRALDAEPTSTELLGRVDDLLREQGSPEDRLALHRAALARAEDPARRRAMLHAIGTIERRDLGDTAAAVATYRRALAEDPGDAAALGALLELYEARGEWEALHDELSRSLARAEGEERIAAVRRLAELSVARGWTERAVDHYRLLLSLDGALGDDVLTAIAEAARAQGDNDLHQAVLERRVAVALDPRDEATWLERLGELESERVGRGEAAAAAFRRAAAAAEHAGDAALGLHLFERVLAAARDDRAAAERLLALYREAGAWDRVPAVLGVLLRTAPSAEDAARTLLSNEDALGRAGAIERFLGEASALLADRGAELPVEMRAALGAARVRVLSADPAREGEAAAAYRAILEGGAGDLDAVAAAFEGFLAPRGSGAAADRRWLFGFRDGRAAEGDRVAILLEWADVEEHVHSDPAAAAALYERVIALDPEHDAALSARARILLGRGDVEGAVALLATRRDRAEGSARAALDLELGTLLLDRLNRPEEALDRIAPALEAGADGPALDLARRLLARPETMVRAASLIEQVAEGAPDPATRSALLEVLLSTPPGVVELAEARRGWFERLLGAETITPEESLGIALRAVGEIPSDISLWDRAEKLARETHGAAKLAEAYRRALGIGAAERPPLEGMDGDALEELGRRAVEYHEEWFDEQETVIALLRRTVELSPGSTWAFERLKLTYNLGERWDELFDLYDEVIARTEDKIVCRELLEDAALAAKDLAADTGRAMRYFEELLAIRDDARIRTALERLYERHGRHRPLIALLAKQLGGLEGEAAQKLRARIAGLWLEGAADPGSAVEVIERMIEAEPDRAEAFELLERVMTATASDKPPGEEALGARQRAASLLKDRYRAEGRAQDLARVLVVDLEAAGSSAERAARLRALVKLRLTELGDEAGAFEGVASLLLLEPGEAEHRAELERLASKLGRLAELGQVLAAAAEKAEGRARLDLLARAAAVYRNDLGDSERAIALHRAILAGAPAGDPAALGAARELDRLLGEKNLFADRCDILETLASIEPEAPARRAARAELARIAWSEIGDPERAIRAFRAALGEDARDVEALDGLARALEEGGRWAELCEVLAQRASYAEGAAARRDRVRVARILDEHLGDAAQAIAAWIAVREAFGADEESADALGALLEKTARWAELGALLEQEATSAISPARGADLWRKVGDLHRERTGNWGESIAAYDLALSLRAGDEGARRGLQDLVARLAGDASAEGRSSLGAATALLLRLYGAADDWDGTIALLEPRLLTAPSDAARVAILLETAGLQERRRGDVAAAFDAIFRAITLAPSEALAADAIRLAGAADRWSVIASALEQGFDARADVPANVARSFFWHIALWHRDRREDFNAAEDALGRVLARDPGSVEVLSALADVQRRSPGRPLVDTLLLLAEARGGDLDRLGEAVEIAEGPAGDGALAESIAEKLLATATERWTSGAAIDGARFPTAASAASWAIEALVRLSQRAAARPERAVELFLRGAKLPFEATERRRLRLCAADLAAPAERVAIYEELFGEDADDPLPGERLEALYRELDRGADLIHLRERQIAVARSLDRRVELRFDLAALRASAGDAAAAISALRETLGEAPAHAASAERLGELLEQGAHHADLVALCEEQAARIAAGGDRAGAAAMWAKAAALSESRLSDAARAIADHRRAAALGDVASADALSRLLIARGEHAAAAEVLESLCEKASPEALHLLALRLTDAHLAAGKPAAARARLERYLPLARESVVLRERLGGLYREAGEWGPLAGLVAESAARAGSPDQRAALLREAAAIHLDRRGDAASAVPFLEQAAAIQPDDTALRRLFASALIESGKLDEAAASLRELIAGYGTRRPKDRALAHRELARVALASGDRATAVAELDLALRIDPAHPEILELQARLALEEGQLDRAARTYRALLLVVRRPREEMGPGGVSRAEVLFELREIARLQGDAERAAEYLESAFETARESAAENERLLGRLRLRKAHDILARALEARLAAGAEGAAAAALLEELGGLYDEHLGRSTEALESRLKALTLAPPSPARLAATRESARRAGQLDRYVGVVEKLAAAATESAHLVDLHLALGGAVEGEGEGDARAVAAYRAAEALLEEGSDDARLFETRAALARLHERLGDDEALGALLEKQIECSGDGPAAAEALYRLAGLRLGRREALADGIAALERAMVADPQPERAETLLRRAVAVDPESREALAALEKVARDSGSDRMLVDALVMIWQREASPAAVEGERGPLEEAVGIARHLGDDGLVEELLQLALGRASTLGDAAFGWALSALSERRAAGGELGEAAALKERAARAASPDRERTLLLETAALSAGALGDLPRAGRLYEELRAREPAEREIWQPLADVYRRLGDRDRLGALLDETAKILDSAAERAELRLERARMAMADDEAKAMSLLTEIVQDDPAAESAAALLSDLLEKHGKKEELAALYQRRIDIAKDREDVPSIVALSLKLGAMLEGDWDESGALDVYHAALDWDGKSCDLLRAVVRIAMAREDSIDLGSSLDQLLAVEQGEAAAELGLRLGRLRAAQGDAAGAEKALEQGFAEAPGNAELKEELERRYTASESWQKLAHLHVREAEGIADKARKVEALCRAADILREHAEDAAGAAAILLHALDVDPSDRDVLLALIDAYGALGEHRRAVDAIGKALGASPDDPWLYRSRASLHEALGDDDAALADLEAAYTRSNGGYSGELVLQIEKAIAASRRAAGPDSPAHERALRLRLADVLARSGEIDRARAELVELTRTDGRDRAALRALAALEDAHGSWDAASATYRRLLPLEDGEALAEAALRLADACARGDHLGEARGALERAMRAAPGHAGVRAKLRAVYNVLGAGRELAALILEDAAAASDPAERLTALLHAGRLLLEAGGEEARAIAVLEEARALKPDDQDVALLLADAHAAAGRLSEARALLDAAAAAHKGRRSKQASAVHRQRARLELAAGDAAASLASLSRAFEGDPQNGALALELGQMALDLDDAELASRAFRAVTLMKVAPAGSLDGVTIAVRAHAYYHLGRLAVIQGDRRKARLMIDKAVADDPTHEGARALLAELRAG